jgi:hypothetical protein
MTVSRRERPDAALAIERRHGLRARRPPRGMPLPSRSGPARRAAWECESARSQAATVWVMSGRRLRHACLFRELRSGDEYIVRAPLPLKAVAQWQRGVNQWHRSRAVHRYARSSCAYHPGCLSRCESLDTRVARVVVLAPQIALVAKARCHGMNKIGARDTGIDRAVPPGT